jgi:hypothetical protein
MNCKSIFQKKTLKLNKAQPYRLSKTHGESSTRNDNKQQALKLASTIAKNDHNSHLSQKRTNFCKQFPRLAIEVGSNREHTSFCDCQKNDIAHPTSRKITINLGM